MEFIIELFLEVIVHGFISFPGALIIWFIKGRKTEFKAYFDEKYWQSFFVGALFWAFVILIIYVLN